MAPGFKIPAGDLRHIPGLDLIICRDVPGAEARHHFLDPLVAVECLQAFTTASRFVFAPVKRMASANTPSGISIVVFMDSKLSRTENPAMRKSRGFHCAGKRKQLPSLASCRGRRFRSKIRHET